MRAAPMSVQPFPTLPEEDRLALVAVQDPQAFAALYRYYYPRLFNYVRYRCVDQQTTEDLVAQAFTRALDQLDRFDPARGPFSAWLFAITRNLVGCHCREQRRHAWLPFEQLDGHSPEADGPEEQVIRQESCAALLAALDRLGERERDLLGLKFGGRLTNRQIAILVGMSESNVGVVLHRAIRRLRIQLEEAPLPQHALLGRAAIPAIEHISLEYTHEGT
jgi:RNA polymerase sigma factor (sigma-70 family)